MGSTSAIFLHSLHWVTQYRENHLWLIALLPIGGFLVGLLYHIKGQNIEGGNAIWLNALRHPEQTIPFKMAPFTYIGTMVTHLLGGSAGREGAAIQMATAVSYPLAKPLNITSSEKNTLLIAAIAAGFGSVFGTPMAGAVFALEVAFISRLRYKAILPAFLAALLAHIVCMYWGVIHTQFPVVVLPNLSYITIIYCLIAAIMFGICAAIFNNAMQWTSVGFKKFVKYAPFRPLIGGVIIASAVFAMGNTTYIGLGIPTIVASFTLPLPTYTFAIKIIFTVVTLSAGFKGGEVTPLFFIGAALGNALFLIIPLPISLLAAMGFVAVFAGVSKAPLACLVMGVELFGINCAVYIVITCVIAYFIAYYIDFFTQQKLKKPQYNIFKNKQDL